MQTGAARPATGPDRTGRRRQGTANATHGIDPSRRLGPRRPRAGRGARPRARRLPAVDAGAGRGERGAARRRRRGRPVERRDVRRPAPRRPLPRRQQAPGHAPRRRDGGRVLRDDAGRPDARGRRPVVDAVGAAHPDEGAAGPRRARAHRSRDRRRRGRAERGRRARADRGEVPLRRPAPPRADAAGPDARVPDVARPLLAVDGLAARQHDPVLAGRGDRLGRHDRRAEPLPPAGSRDPRGREHPRHGRRAPAKRRELAPLPLAGRTTRAR